MPVCSVAVDPVDLRECCVVVERKVSAILQAHLRQHGGVVIVWTIYQQSTTEPRCYPNLTVVEGRPVMPNSTPALPDCLKVAAGVIQELHNSAQSVSDRLQMAIGAVVRGRNVIAVAILNLPAPVLIVNTGWCERVLSAIGRTNGRSINISDIQLRIAAVLRFVNI